MIDITLRSSVNRSLTHTEVDNNFLNLKNGLEQIEQTFSINFVGVLAQSLHESRYYPSKPINVKKFYLSFGIVPSSNSYFKIKKNDIELYTINVVANTFVTEKTAIDIPLEPTDYLSIDSYISTGKNLRIVFIYE
jgi:hypothetical protein